MASSDFMQRLASHFEAGRLDSESFEAIKAFEQPEPTSLVIGSVMPPGTKEPEVEMNHPGIKDHAMRFALGSAAATGATMVLFGVGFLCMLLSGEVVSAKKVEGKGCIFTIHSVCIRRFAISTERKQQILVVWNRLK